MKIPLQRVKRNGKVEVWDLGPQVAPKVPEAPAEPERAKFKNPAEFAAAELEYEAVYDQYKESLRAYNAQKVAYREWHATNGGPVKIEFWGVDAEEADQNNPGRYALDLPRGVKQGRAQTEADERAKVEAEELARATANDPQFGQQAGAAA